MNWFGNVTLRPIRVMCALYSNYSKDEPYTGMNEILKMGLHGGLSALAENVKNKPSNYWKLQCYFEIYSKCLKNR